jgi:hypothetical protein
MHTCVNAAEAQVLEPSPGGAYSNALYHCTLSGNTGYGGGGGAFACTLYNCISSGNSEFDWDSAIYYSLGDYYAMNGVGNIDAGTNGV